MQSWLFVFFNSFYPEGYDRLYHLLDHFYTKLVLGHVPFQTKRNAITQNILTWREISVYVDYHAAVKKQEVNLYFKDS